MLLVSHAFTMCAIGGEQRRKVKQQLACAVCISLPHKTTKEEVERGALTTHARAHVDTKNTMHAPLLAPPLRPQNPHTCWTQTPQLCALHVQGQANSPYRLDDAAPHTHTSGGAPQLNKQLLETATNKQNHQTTCCSCCCCCCGRCVHIIHTRRTPVWEQKTRKQPTVPCDASGAIVSFSAARYVPATTP